jgi:hypothetical protein
MTILGWKASKDHQRAFKEFQALVNLGQISLNQQSSPDLFRSWHYEFLDL